MGILYSGEEIRRYRLQNSAGAYCDIATLGGCVLRLCVPDRHGVLDDVILGYDTLTAVREWGGHMGMLVGRFANRISQGRFTLNGQQYQLARNNGENHLHGGPNGFHKKVWMDEVDGETLILSLVSPDGDEGYPGLLRLVVSYAFSENNTLSIRYEAVSEADTIINPTNHAFFNLGGLRCATILDHLMQINADSIVAVSGRGCIPSGKFMPVTGTPFDFRTLRKIGAGMEQPDASRQLQFGNGYNHNYVIRNWDKSLRCAARTEEPVSGRAMETWTDMPGVQFYSGNGLGNYPHTRGKLGQPYHTHQAFCLETQYFPDNVNQASFPSCVLRKGQIFKSKTEYRFSTINNCE
jgi:aldose 1-epimerase